MDDQAASRKALAEEYFRVTGDAIPENDPIVTGALFFSRKLAEASASGAKEIGEAARLGVLELREASRLAGADLREAALIVSQRAGEAGAKASDVAAVAQATIDNMLADRTEHLRVIEAHMLKCVRAATKEQSKRHGTPYVPIWYAVIGAFVGAVLIAAAVKFGVEHGSAREREASVGRTFSRVMPTLDPKLKEQLLEHIRKNAG